MSKDIKDNFPLPKIGAFTNEKSANAFMEKQTGESGIIRLGWKNDAQACFATSPDYGMVATIALNDEMMKDDSPEQKLATLVHECSHTVYDYFNHLGDTPPSNEMNAYMMEAVFLTALEQIGLEWFTTPLQPKPKSEKKTD